MPIGALLPATTHWVAKQQVQGLPLHPQIFPQVTVSSEPSGKTPSHAWLDTLKSRLVGINQPLQNPTQQMPVPQKGVAQQSMPVIPAMSTFGQAPLPPLGGTDDIRLTLPPDLTTEDIRRALLNTPPSFVVDATKKRQDSGY